MDSLLEPFTKGRKEQFCVEMMQRLDIQRRNEHFCDVILEVGSGDDQARLKAHRNVLCAASPFFFNALNSEMKEKKEGVIRLEDARKSVMEQVLEYLYTGNVDINEKNAFDLFAQADYFLISSLKARSSKFILQSLSISNCITAYYFALKYQWEELQSGARSYILRRFSAVVETNDFLNLSSKQVEEWISRDDIVIKGEEEVFEVVLRWIEKKGSRNYQTFYDLFQHVRFIYVPRNYLCTVILPHRLVKDRRTCVDLVLEALNCTSDGTEECFLAQGPRDCLKTHEDAIVACGHKKTCCYIPSKNKWYELAGMPSKVPAGAWRYFTSASHGKLFVSTAPANNADGFLVQYDPSLNQWSSVNTNPLGPIPRHSAVVTFHGFLYVIGGADSSRMFMYRDVWKYNPDTKLWQSAPPMSVPRAKVCAVADRQYLYAIGGKRDNGQLLDTVERFDPSTNTWEVLASTLAKRASASGVAMKEKLYIFGGLATEATVGDPCEIYNLTTNTWSGLLSPVAPRCLASAVSFKGKIFVFGAFPRQGRKEMKLQVYNVDENKWEPCTGGPNFTAAKFHKISALRILKSYCTCRFTYSFLGLDSDSESELLGD